MEFIDAENYFEWYASKANNYINQLITDTIQALTKHDTTAKAVLAYLLKMDLLGKKLRGGLAHLGFLCASTDNTEKSLAASVALEVFHTGILIHDDLIDKANLRRGQKTFDIAFGKQHTKHYGKSIALCAGDIAFYLSWKALLACGMYEQNILDTGKVYAKYVCKLVTGQITEISLDNTATESAILNTLWVKSGEYTAELPLIYGYTLAGGKDPQVYNALLEYAKCLGLIFQLRDDYLGLFGDQKTTGKPICSDLRDGKMTLFVYYLRKLASPKQLTHFDRLFGNPACTAKDVLTVQHIMKDSGTLEVILAKIQTYLIEGRKHISNITDDKNLKLLFESILNYSANRIK